MPKFTDSYLRALKAKDRPYTVSDEAERGAGLLLMRVDPDGRRAFEFRYRRGKVDRLLTIGRFDPNGRKGFTLKQAHDKADALRMIVRQFGDPVRHRAAQRRKDDEAARRGTLGDLCTGYVDHLRQQGKTSARAVECSLLLHVKGAAPRLWRSPAAEVSTHDVFDILTKIVKAGRTRQYNKTRSYLHAAFRWGASSEVNPLHKVADDKRYALTSNPVSNVKRVEEWDRAGDRHLSDADLAHYLRAIDAIDDVQGAALRFMLLLGGQRVAQALRAPWAAYDFEARSLLLQDSKGKGPVRDHLLPLSPSALAILAPYQTLNHEAPGPFSGDGKHPVHPSTLTKLVTSIAADLHTKHKVEPFTLRDLRRTAETTMQRLGVSKDVRAHLLSHGRASDVQARHYEKHDYFPEKKAALATWEAHLAGLREDRPKRGAKVVQFRARRA